VNLTTEEAVRKLARLLNVKQVHYAGLKDKRAVSFQYVTIEGNIKNLKTKQIELTVIKKTDRKINIGDLKGNEFEITLHGCKELNNLKRLIQEIKKRGVPNYFGLQRFGKNMDNHLTGRYLVKRRFKEAVKIINENSGKNYKSIEEVPKSLLKFFIHAYQSWIFNELLNKYIKENKRPSFRTVSLVGTETQNMDPGTKQLLEKEGVSKKDFEIRELGIKNIGGKRKLFIRTEIDYEVCNKKVKIKFSLPKGSYGTVVLRELCK
jgi:tRNA pseudouridine13 synthase